MKKLERIIGRLLSRLIQKYHLRRYSGFGPGHIFDITVDDISFKMTFNDYKLSGAIIERIEGRREPSTVAIIKSLVNNGSCVVELGGCYGYFTMIMSRCAGDKGKVISIEGTPNNFEILKENLRINGVTNVDTYNCFVTARAEEVVFSTDVRHPYDAIASLDNPGTVVSGDGVSVPAVKLSDFLNRLGASPDYIFMDIE